MPEINVEADLTSVNEQIGKLVEELNKVNSARENLIQQVQNLNGVAMYLRGKIQPEEGIDSSELVLEESEEGELGRSTEYPEPVS
jgi:hypothetical protein